MGRRRRKIIKRVVKPFPKIFVCPLCNELAVAVYHEEGSDKAKVICGNCKASAEVRWLPSYMPVDAYAEFYDIVTGARKPAEEAVQQASSEAQSAQQPPQEPAQEITESEDRGEIREAVEDREG